MGRRRKKRVQASSKEIGDLTKKSYDLVEKENASFNKYYHENNLIPCEEWTDFISCIKTSLPIALRICRLSDLHELILKIFEQVYLPLLEKMEDCQELSTCGNSKVYYKKLDWYSHNLSNSTAWQINISRYQLKDALFSRFYALLLSANDSGFISRQEAVSMMPVCLLQIQPHHKVLDMCAAPGSKTTQIIECLRYLSSEHSRNSGFVIANDSNYKRCYNLAHNLKNSGRDDVLITNNDASVFPNIRFPVPSSQNIYKNLKFDRILCDVPCSGDGTIRKNILVWRSWAPTMANSLHKLQVNIVKRGLELLEVDGLLTYSTCSLNPIENEAVVACILDMCKDSVKLLDATSNFPSLKLAQPLKKWILMDKKGNVYERHEELPDSLKAFIRPSCFSSTASDDALKSLDMCAKVLPHHNDTGGFFVALFKKINRLPWTSEEEDKVYEFPHFLNKCSNADGTQDRVFNKPKTKFKQENFVFFDCEQDDKNSEVWQEIKEFYDISSEFPTHCLFYRSNQGSSYKIYYIQEVLKKIIQLNSDRLLFINAGLRVLSRNKDLKSKCSYYLSHEGIAFFSHFLRTQIVILSLEDVKVLLSHETCPIAALSLEGMEHLNETSIMCGGVCIICKFPSYLLLHSPSNDSLETGEIYRKTMCIYFTGWKTFKTIRLFLANNIKKFYKILFDVHIETLS